MRERLAVIGSVRIRVGSDPHRLRGVPGVGVERQFILVQCKVGPRGAADGHRHVARRHDCQLHGVGGMFSCVDRQRTLRQHQIRCIVVRHSNVDELEHRPVAAARARVPHPCIFVGPVRVMACGHSHPLGVVPVVGGERQFVLVQGEVISGKSVYVQRYVTIGSCRQLDRVGGAFSLADCQRGGRKHQIGHVVVRHGNREILADRPVAAARGGVCDRLAVMTSVLVLARGDPHRLRGIPAAGGERQGGSVQRKVSPRSTAGGHGYVSRRLQRQLDGVGGAFTLADRQRGRRKHQIEPFVVDHGNGNFAAKASAAAISKYNVLQLLDIIDLVSVLTCRHRYRLRGVPVVRGERQRFFVQCKVCS